MGIPVKLVDLARQHEPLERELAKSLAEVIRRGDFILGAEVTRFEEEFAAYCGAKFGVGVDSGSSALELALRAMGVRFGDEVVIPAFSFVATAWAAKAAGAEPVFVDVDYESMAMDVERSLGAITRATKAIVPVHLYGYPLSLDSLLANIPKGCEVLEDACQAHGASFGSRLAGTAGKAGAFSFYPSKNLGGIGDGGMVVTNDEALADEVRALRNYGRGRDGKHTRPAMNRRLDAIQASVLRVKLKHLDDWNEQRRAAAALYRKGLAGTKLLLPPEPPMGRHCYHTFTVRSGDRNALAHHLASRGVETRVHYEEPLNRLPILAPKEGQRPAFPVAERLAREVLSLPMFPGIRREEIDAVTGAILEFEAGGKR